MIYIGDGNIIRLVYNTLKTTESFDATLYDYNITDGKVYSDKDLTDEITDEYYDNPDGYDQVYVKTAQQGINSTDNYDNDETGKLAFGNENTGTGLKDETLGDYYINSNNSSGSGHQVLPLGCSFGIVSTLLEIDDNNASLNYNVDAPDLFNDNDTQGKEVINGDTKINFTQEGDTYTIYSIVNETANLSCINLQNFNYYGYGIYSNNFWPLDNLEYYDCMDVKFGSNDNYTNKKICYVNEDGTALSLPLSDDGEDHNSYFGMYFEVTFSLDGDYCGPLDYIFFGDDDMWVYLDDKLICDIGGVHSSVGEYVDLWDYLSNDKETDLGEHTLRFYYTERGASGSTCYMQFTLPYAGLTTTPSSTTGELEIIKEVTGDITTLPDKISFTITDENDKEYKTIDYDDFDIDKSASTDDTTVYTCKLTEVPIGTYSIKENNANVNGYNLDVTGNYTTKVLVNMIGKFTITNDYTKMKDVVDSTSRASIDGDAVSVGQKLTYTVEYTNDTDEKQEVVITDAAPEGTSYIGNTTCVVTGDNGYENKNAANPTEDTGAGSVKWKVSLEAGQTVKVTFDVEVLEEALGETINNEATINVGDNPSITTNTVTNYVPVKDVYDSTNYTESDSPTSINGDTVSVGQELTYTVEYTNDTDATQKVVITDAAPDYTEYKSETAAGAVIDTNGNEKALQDSQIDVSNSGEIKWTVDELGAGETLKISFNVEVLEAALSKTIVNDATVKVDNDPEITTNTVTNYVPDPVKDVVNSKNISINGDLVSIGDTLTYTIEYTNDSTKTQEVVISDSAPEGTSYKGNTTCVVTGDNGYKLENAATPTENKEAGSVEWKLSLEAGQTVKVTFDVEVLDSAVDNPDNMILNYATLNIDGGPNIQTNTVTNTVPEKDVVDSKGNSIDGDLVSIGDTLTYTIEYTNDSTKTQTVVISDSAPDGTSYKGNTTYVVTDANGN
ncbi:MAG: isopeptide-forming domain-containing fimbrial protein, partial [Erysipelotrichaceae bacterium]|nr:isopeptide-forming domain-containing fimbrial protein [Erysipelotrichaceae bacterium]